MYNHQGYFVASLFCILVIKTNAMKKLFTLFAFAISVLLTVRNITFAYEHKYKPNISKDSIV